MSEVTNRATLPRGVSDEFDRQAQALALQWDAVPYDQGNFTTGTNLQWTVPAGNQYAYQSVMLGPAMMLLVCRLNNTTVDTAAGNGNRLRVRIPGGRLSARAIAGWGFVIDNGTGRAARVTSDVAGGAWLIVSRDDNANLSASTKATTISVGAIIELVPEG